MGTLAVRLGVPVIKASKGLSPSSHFPVGFRLPVDSASHDAARHAWRTSWYRCASSATSLPTNCHDSSLPRYRSEHKMQTNRSLRINSSGQFEIYTQTIGQVRYSRVQTLRIVRFPYPIYSGRFLPILALEACVQPLGLEQQTHQGVEPSPRRRKRSLCETNKSCCHGHRPLSVGPCLPYSLSQTGTPLLGLHYQTSSLLWMPPTPHCHRPLPRFLHFSEGAHSLCANGRFSLVTA